MTTCTRTYTSKENPLNISTQCPVYLKIHISYNWILLSIFVVCSFIVIRLKKRVWIRSWVFHVSIDGSNPNTNKLKNGLVKILAVAEKTLKSCSVPQKMYKVLVKNKIQSSKLNNCFSERRSVQNLTTKKIGWVRTWNQNRINLFPHLLSSGHGNNFHQICMTASMLSEKST
jgi:hypothetical protein